MASTKYAVKPKKLSVWVIMFDNEACAVPKKLSLLKKMNNFGANTNYAQSMPVTTIFIFFSASARTGGISAHFAYCLLLRWYTIG